MSHRCLLASSALLLVLILAGCQDPQLQAVRRALEARLTQDSLALREAPEELRGTLERFYKGRAYRPAWTDGAEPLPAAQALLEALPAADAAGFHPAYSAARRVEQAYAAADPSPDTLAQLDIRLTRAFLRHAHNLAAGRVDPDRIDPSWDLKREPVDLAVVLQQALAGDSLAATLQGLLPQHDAYVRLAQAEARYRRIVEAGGWPEIPPGPTLSAGDRSDRVPTLRRRLTVTGDFDAAARDTARGSRVFGTALADALMHFQRRHNIEPTGILDAATREALNVPAEVRLRTIRLNLERWRWVPPGVTSADRYVMVNVPDFKLRAYEDGQIAQEMAVVVGAAYSNRATPVFADSIEHLIFNPYWNVPPSIAEAEILPAARSSANYMARNNYQLVRYFGPDAETYPITPANLRRVAAGELLVRQASGPQNALGQVKFMFPNEHAIYLHDTPAEYLFEKTNRTFSHGCVRVERPIDLAAFALQRQSGWDRSRIGALMEGAEWKLVELRQKIPVYLLYFTAFADRQGDVHFSEDLYGRDDALLKALRAAS